MDRSGVAALQSRQLEACRKEYSRKTCHIRKHDVLLVIIILTYLAGRFSTGRVFPHGWPDLHVRYLVLPTFLVCLALPTKRHFAPIESGATCYRPELERKRSSCFFFLSTAYSGFLMISSLYSPCRELALLKLQETAFLVILLVLLIFTLRQFGNEHDVLRVIAPTFLLVATAYLVPIYWSAIAERARGAIFIGGPNVATRVLFFGSMSSLYLMMRTGKARYLILSCLLLVGIVLLGSRGGIFGAALALLVLMAVRVSTLRIRLPRRIVRYWPLYIALAILALPSLYGPVRRVFVQRVLYLTVTDLHVAGRDAIFEAALYLIEDLPTLGYGLNAFLAATGYRYPHNLLLEMIIETGAIGAVFWLVFLTYSLQIVCSSKGTVLYLFSTLPLYMMVVHMVSGDIFDFRYYFFWMAVLLQFGQHPGSTKLKRSSGGESVRGLVKTEQ